MPSLSEAYEEFAADLTARYGRPSAARPTAPDRTRWLCELVLSRQLAGRKAGECLEALDSAGFLEPSALATSDPADLEQVIGRVGGQARKLLVTIQRIGRWIVEAGGFDALDGRPTEALREELRAIRGVGPTLADVVLLGAFGRAAFPLDRPAYRVLVRHGWLDPCVEYDEARSSVESLGSGDPAALEDLAGWLDRVSEDYCKVAAPRCERCPLRPWLPPQGPIEPDN
jgi:endonuclease-3 related protein